MISKAAFYRALEAVHSGGLALFEQHVVNSQAWLNTETRIAVAVDHLVSPALEAAFLAFAIAPRGKRADPPGLGKSPAAAAKLLGKLKAGAEEEAA